MEARSVADDLALAPELAGIDITIEELDPICPNRYPDGRAWYEIGFTRAQIVNGKSTNGRDMAMPVKYFLNAGLLLDFLSLQKVEGKEQPWLFNATYNEDVTGSYWMGEAKKA